MNQLPFYNRVLVLLIDFVGLWLGVRVYKENPKNRLNKIFLGMVISMFFWVNFAYLARLIGVEKNNLSLLFLKIAWVVTPLLFIFLYFFIIFLFKKRKKYSVLSTLVSAIGGVAILGVGATNLVVEDIKFIGGELSIVYGKGMIPFLFFVIFFMVATLYVLLKEFISLSKEERIRINYLFLGVLIFYIANGIFNIFLPLILKIYRFYWIGDYSAIFLLGLIAYAVIKKELFGVKVVLTTVLVGLIAILLLVNVVGSKTTFEYIWKGGLFVAFLIFGYLLIRSVFREIRRREEMERMTRELQKAYAELKEVDKAKSEFIAMASHQLRTPLTIVKGLSSMILEGMYGKPPKKMKKHLRSIFESNERLVGIVNDLLDISKADLGRLELELEKTDLNELVDGVVNELEKKAEDKGLEIKWNKPKKASDVVVDPIKMRQVIFNLIDNAIRYTKEGEVRVNLEEVDSKVRIIVEDTGEGMGEQEKEKVFERFTRGEAGINRWVQGAGLGLYLSKRYIQLHKGRIWAESPGKGKGSTFYVEVPKKVKKGGDKDKKE